MELPEDVAEFAEWFKTDSSDTQKIDKLAFVVGLQRTQGESNESLLNRVARQKKSLNFR